MNYTLKRFDKISFGLHKHVDYVFDIRFKQVTVVFISGHGVLQNEADGDRICGAGEDYSTQDPDEAVPHPHHQPGHGGGHSAGLEVGAHNSYQ